MQRKSPLFALQVLPPGSCIGYHQHTEDVEAYYIIKGVGRVNDNGTAVTVSSGDMVFCAKGDSHSIENIGDGNLDFIALKLFA